MLLEFPNTNGIFLGIVTYFPANKLILLLYDFVNVPDDPDVTDTLPLVNVKCKSSIIVLTLYAPFSISSPVPDIFIVSPTRKL